MGRFRETTVVVEKQYVLHVLSVSVCLCFVCVCSPICPACEARVSNYIAICGLSGCTLFFHFIP
jgi:hypothetical protein